MSVDPVAAVTSYLAADASVGVLTSGRVFGGTLPRSEATAMPRAAVVVKPSGGGFLSHGDYGDLRVDLACYGSTPHESWRLYLACRLALKALRRMVIGETLVHWTRVFSEGASGIDPDTDWPVTLASWQVFSADIAA